MKTNFKSTIRMKDYVSPPIFITIPVKINFFGLRPACPLRKKIIIVTGVIVQSHQFLIKRGMR